MSHRFTLFVNGKSRFIFFFFSSVWTVLFNLNFIAWTSLFFFLLISFCSHYRFCLVRSSFSVLLINCKCVSVLFPFQSSCFCVLPSCFMKPLDLFVSFGCFVLSSRVLVSFFLYIFRSSVSLVFHAAHASRSFIVSSVCFVYLFHSSFMEMFHPRVFILAFVSHTFPFSLIHLFYIVFLCFIQVLRSS